MRSFTQCRYISIILWVIGIFELPQTTLAREVIVGLEDSGIKKIKIAVAPMIASSNSQIAAEEISDKLTQVLRNDLEVSGFFDTLQNKTDVIAQLHESEKGSENSNFSQWIAQTEAQALIKCIYTLQQGNLSLECRVYDTEKGSQILGKAYDTDSKQARKVIHRFADEVILKYTGERGVSETNLLFISTRSKNREVYRIDFDGENMQRLTNDRSITLSPSWSPDGKQILYTGYRDNNPDLFIVGSNGGAPKPISVFAGLNLGGKWAPDGNKIALTLSKDGNSEIYLLEPNTKNYQRLTRNSWSDVSPSWSPDGSRIAFTSDASGTPQVYIMDSSGANIRRLTFVGNYSTSPAWSPKGDRIAFAAIGREGRFDIYTINIDGSNTKALTSSGNNEDPTWSRDGRYIAFHSNRTGSYSIYIMNQDGNNLRRLTDTQGNDTSPAWSP
jgi:TolB protein